MTGYFGWELLYAHGFYCHMSRSIKWRLFLPLLMSFLFLFALLRAELRWRECASEEGRVCFGYPLYLPYGLRQQIDVHWMATLPALVLRLYSAGMSVSYDREPFLPWPRIVITFLSCVTVWSIIGLWLQRLREARHLTDHSRVARRLVLALVLVFVPFSIFVVYLV